MVHIYKDLNPSLLDQIYIYTYKCKKIKKIGESYIWNETDHKKIMHKKMVALQYVEDGMHYALKCSHGLITILLIEH